MRPKTALRGLQDSNFAGSLQGLCRVPPPAKTLQRPCKDPAKTLQYPCNTLQSSLQRPCKDPGGPKRPPRSPENHPRSPQQAQKRPQRGPQTAPTRPQNCLQHAPERPPTISQRTSKRPITRNPGTVAGLAVGNWIKPLPPLLPRSLLLIFLVIPPSTSTSFSLPSSTSVLAVYATPASSSHPSLIFLPPNSSVSVVSSAPLVVLGMWEPISPAEEAQEEFHEIIYSRHGDRASRHPPGQ